MAACHHNPPIVELSNHDQPSVSQNLASANHYIAQSEETQIDGYVQRRNWMIQRLNCGARLHVYYKGNGSAINYEDSVSVRYSVSTLNDKLLYSNQTVHFKVGRMLPTVGLDQAALALHHGSKAHLVVPSDAAYGVRGDGDRIPTRTVLVYDLEVL